METVLPKKLLVTKCEAQEILGVGDVVFAEISRHLAFVRPRKRKYYYIQDIINYLEENKEYKSCTDHLNNYSKRNPPVITQTLRSMGLGLDEAVKQTIKS